uniref:Tetratricopeptide repeat protein 39B n=1 Tax=Heterorhabditis bacteriophora TaxID=37862 RepID=A0A1I7X2V4_HETBA
MSEVERPRSLSKLTTGTVSESDTEYLDATEHVTYSDSLELLDTIAETQITLNLFLNNKFDMAEERMAELADRSMYHSLGLNSIVFIKAMMTCDKKDMEKSLQLCKKSCTMIEGFRQKFSLSETFLSLGGKQRHITDGIISLFIQFTYELYILITFYLINTIRVLIEIYYLYLCSTIPKFLPIKEEIHAELCYAETLLCRAVLSFFQDDNFTSFLRGALRIRTCYQIYSLVICISRSCERMMNDYSLWEGRDPQVRSQFESGVRMGLGTFNLMLSTLPSKVLRLLEV